MVKSSTTGKVLAKAKASAANSDIETLSISVLEKLRSLKLSPQLQADLEWCIGSYRYDNQPAGLLHHLSRAREVFKEELSKKTKGVTAKYVADLDKAVNSLL